jgi:hypothetical protein
MKTKNSRMSRRTTTLIGCAVIAAITITLLYFERVDILYVLATLAIVVLLAIVANADLEGKAKIKEQ